MTSYELTCRNNIHIFSRGFKKIKFKIMFLVFKNIEDELYNLFISYQCNIIFNNIYLILIISILKRSKDIRIPPKPTISKDSIILICNISLYQYYP